MHLISRGVAIVMIAAPALLFSGGCSDSSEGTNGNGDGIGTDTIEGDGVEGDGVSCQTEADCAGIELTPCESVSCEAGVCKVEALADGTECKDGKVCTGPDYCIGGKCGGGPLNCDDFDPCTQDWCDPKSGCVHAPDSGAVCDDGNACTEGDKCFSGGCEGTPIDGCCLYDAECDDGDVCTDDDCKDNTCGHKFNFAPCNDGKKCTLKDHCDGAGTCTGDGLVCDDGNPCTLDGCDPLTGTCTVGVAPDGTPCEDGNPCTTPDTCQSGACVSESSLCQCTTDADCVEFEDADLCNGTLKCLDFKCVVDPITVVACNPTGDTACVKNQCDPATGQCVPTTQPEGTACDDQNTCTDEDQCTGGLCIGTSKDCNDGNPCTFDACSVATGCTNIPNTQPCNDGNACTDNDQCNAGACTGEALACNDGNPCTDDSCDPALGCVHTNNTAACDDGNACTDGDACAGGACVSGGNTCACVNDSECADSEDDNLCNGTLKCVANECVVDPTTIVTCNTSGDTACLKTVCAPATGQCVPQAQPDGAPCSDGDACTNGDSCQSGACTGTGVSCDDGNPCTTDTCDATNGCANVPNTLQCNDGDPCTGNDKCQSGNCSGVAITCDDGNQCTIDTCDPVAGCQSTPATDGTACDDANKCTVSDVCTGGVCGGVAKNCDDGNPCTADTCANSNPTGCANTPLADNTPCNDGSACTGGDKCVAGQCVGSPPSCDDGDPCTVDSCDPAVGCQYSNAANGTGCSDGDPCTAPDACDAGTCVSGSYVCGCQVDSDCTAEEDGNLCNGTLFCDTDGNCKVDPATIVTCADPPDPCVGAVCNTTTGACQDVPAADGAACDDGDDCTTNDTCQSGSCTGFLQSCDDGNPCTADSCVDGACQYLPAFDGQACADDGNSCTLDVCQSGSCGHLSVVDGTPCADDGNSCTNDWCDKGACQHPSVSDGLPCTDDGNQCTYDQCTSGVCQHISNDPAPVSAGQCFPVQEIEANTGTVTNSWTDCGTADQFQFCTGNGGNQTCGNTGAISNWPCADPAFEYEGTDTGYEYSYVFVAPTTGTCTLIEHDEGVKVVGPGGGLFGVIDWFILSGGSCDASACLEYMWENKTGDPVCGGGNKTCSYKDFAVTEGQVFYFVADIFDGLSGTHENYNFNDSWTIEVVCDSGEVLLINEDFSDAVCNGCSDSVNAPQQCQDFGWHAIGGFNDIVTGYYLGELQNNTLLGYDCGATTASLDFPQVTLPANATSCTLSFDLYMDIDPADDGDCTNDILEVMASVGGGQSQPVPGDSCASGTTSSNPFGDDTNGNVQTMTYDLTYAAGNNVTVSLDWSADAAANTGVGVIIDNVKLACEVP